MANDPQIVYPQNPLTSKTVLVNIVGALITWAVVKYGLGSVLTPDLQNQLAIVVAMAIMSGLNLLVRHFVKGPLSFSAPLTQTPAQPLPSGGAVVVATSPADSGAPAEVSPVPPGESMVTVRPRYQVPLSDAPPPIVTITPAR